MLTLLLSGAALASDERDLPPAPDVRPAPPTKGLASWIGVTPPVVGMPFEASAPLGLAADLDVRFASTANWIQPELRVALMKDFAIVDRVLLPGTDTMVLATFGARFGTDRGFYGGLTGGIEATWVQAEEAGGMEFGAAFSVYSGYAFAVSDRVRVSPELTLGTINTLAVRVEWGG